MNVENLIGSQKSHIKVLKLKKGFCMIHDVEKKTVLINVLDEVSYKDCHIKGSLNIPLSDLMKAAGSFDKNTEIVVYCASSQCPLSKKAWHALSKLGFINVFAYEGGMREWHAQNLPTQGSCLAGYLKPTDKADQENDNSVKIITTEQLKKKLHI